MSSQHGQVAASQNSFNPPLPRTSASKIGVQYPNTCDLSLSCYALNGLCSLLLLTVRLPLLHCKYNFNFSHTSCLYFRLTYFCRFASSHGNLMTEFLSTSFTSHLSTKDPVTIAVHRKFVPEVFSSWSSVGWMMEVSGQIFCSKSR